MLLAAGGFAQSPSSPHRTPAFSLNFILSPKRGESLLFRAGLTATTIRPGTRTVATLWGCFLAASGQGSRVDIWQGCSRDRAGGLLTHIWPPEPGSVPGSLWYLRKLSHPFTPAPGHAGPTLASGCRVGQPQGSAWLGPAQRGHSWPGGEGAAPTERPRLTSCSDWGRPRRQT